MAHGALPCGARRRSLMISQRRNDIPHGRCPQHGCEDVWDTLTHGFLECPRVHRVWVWVCEFWVAVAGGSAPPLTADVLLCGLTAPVWQPNWSLWHVIRAISITCISQAREKAFASGLHISPTRVACRIVIALRDLMRSDFLAATRCSAVRALYGTPAASADNLRRRFRKHWRPGGVLCSVDDAHSVLHMHLTPSHPVPVPH